MIISNNYRPITDKSRQYYLEYNNAIVYLIIDKLLCKYQ